MQHHFRVAVRLKNVALPDQIGTQLGRVDQIAVVTQGDLAMNAVNQYRLRVDDPAIARRRVPDSPTATSPVIEFKNRSSNASETCPMALVRRSRSPSAVAIPALS